MNDSSLPLTIKQFRAITGCNQAAAIKYIEFFKGACKAFDITTPTRLAMFGAQLGHESASLSRVIENLNYSKVGLLKTFSKYFNETTAGAYAHKPQAIANIVYANRMGNGNEASGEGWKYRGRGFIQLTGKNNYKAAGEYFGVDFVGNPDLVLEPVWCCLVSAWFWYTNNLNNLADKKDVLPVTKKINGGTHGLQDRTDRFKTAVAALEQDGSTLA
jgi:putative chitinase